MGMQTMMLRWHLIYFKLNAKGGLLDTANQCRVDKINASYEHVKYMMQMVSLTTLLLCVKSMLTLTKRE